MDQPCVRSFAVSRGMDQTVSVFIVLDMTIYATEKRGGGNGERMLVRGII